MTNDNPPDPFADTIVAEAPAAPQANGPTDKQIAFATKLLGEKDHGYPSDVIELWKTQSRKAVSDHIDFLISRDRKPAASPGQAAAAMINATNLVEGIYVLYGTSGHTFFRVYLTRETKQKVCSQLTVTRDAVRDETGAVVEPAQAEWNYLGKAGLTQLTPANKCSHEEASKFGSLYGICCACTADLNDPISVYHGYGPTCAANNGWPRLSAAQFAKVLENRGVAL